MGVGRGGGGGREVVAVGEYSGLSEARCSYPQVEIDICFYTYAAVNLFLLFPGRSHSLKAPVKKLKLIF